MSAREPLDQARRARSIAPSRPAPPRPRDDEALGFRRERPVQWYRPTVLLDTGLRVAASATMGDFLDKRELQQGSPAQVVDHATGRSEAWFDYVADTGDGFDATYTVAWLTAQPELAVDGAERPLPRASLLVLGGDQVYPSATSTEYDNRFRGPFRASLPYSEDVDAAPSMVAIPGNHDWYDGLTNFMRLFCSPEDKWIGGRRTLQSRSYFAVRLPANWWLWGIDIQFDAYIDDPQLRYFRTVAAQMGEGSRLILCTAKPSWVDVQGDPLAFRNLAYLEDRVIRPARIDLALSISGDSHHYARYLGEGATHKITAGGGGAFLHPTHHLDDPLDVPADPQSTQVNRHRLQTRYPDARTSRRLSLGAVALAWKSPQFLAVTAALYLLLAWSSEITRRVFSGDAVGSARQAAQGFGWDDQLLGQARSPLSVVVLALVLGGLTAMAKPSADWSRGGRKVVAKLLLGSAHFAAHLAVGGLVGIVAVDLVPTFVDHTGFAVMLAVLVGLVGAVAGGITFGAYLGFCCAFLRGHGNDAFAAMARTSHKNFLRLHIDAGGALTVYPIAIPRSHGRWHYDPDNSAGGAPWLAPDGEMARLQLIEDPVVIRAAAPAPD